MGWLHSLISPLKKFWDRLHSSHRKRNVLFTIISSCLSYYLWFCTHLAFLFWSCLLFLCKVHHIKGFLFSALINLWVVCVICCYRTPLMYWNDFSAKFYMNEITYINNIPCIELFTGRGIYILYKDVKSCPCEDVQVLWSILVESHPASLPSTWSWSDLLCQDDIWWPLVYKDVYYILISLARWDPVQKYEAYEDGLLLSHSEYWSSKLKLILAINMVTSGLPR